MNKNRKILKTLIALALPAMMFFSGCNTGELQEQITTLVSAQQRLASEKDSLSRIVSQTNSALETKSADFDALAATKDELDKRSNSLQASLAARNRQLKEAQAQVAVKDSTINAINMEIEQLQGEITSLNQKIAVVDAAIAEEKKRTEALEQSVAAEREKRIADSAAIANAPKPEVAETRFFNTIEAGGAIGLAQTDAPYAARFVSLHNIAGFEFNRKISAGLGLGVNFYNEANALPLYLDFRYYFSNGPTSLFLIADGGVVFDLQDFDRNTGAFINPQIGLRRALGDRRSMHFSLGYWLQQAPGNDRHSYFTIKGGFTFNGQSKTKYRVR